MKIEQRKESRAHLPHQPRGKLKVLLDGHSHAVIAVKDLSQTGIRIEVTDALPVGGHIQLRYLSEAIDIKFDGTVAWSRQAASETEAPHYVVGISLASPSMLQTVL